MSEIPLKYEMTFVGVPNAVSKALWEGKARVELLHFPPRILITTQTSEARLVECVCEAVADYFKVPADALKGPHGSRQLTDAKAVVRWILTKEHGLSQPKTAELLQLTTHGTVQKSNIHVQNMLDTEKSWPVMMDNLKNAIQRKLVAG